MKSQIAILFVLIPIFLSSQDDSTFFDFSAYIVLDSIMVTAERSGFSMQEFITIIQNDKSLQESFYNLRKLSYTYENNIKFVNSQGKSKASYHSINTQYLEKTCQWMKVETEEITGNFLTRKANYKYYTSRLYDRVFYVSKVPCEQRISETVNPTLSRPRRILEQRISELKKLIYTPGQQADIPLIGKRTAIFNKTMIEKYDLSLTSGMHESGVEAYIFRANVKPLINTVDPNSTVVKNLEVYIEKGNLQVLTRNYKLQYNSGVYDFDILMKVNLSQHEDKYIPTHIQYDGYWNVVGKQKEDCIFDFKLLEILH